MPIDKFGADCLFQIISHRCERGATMRANNRVFKRWASINQYDAVLTSALLDRLLIRAETVLVFVQGATTKTPKSRSETPLLHWSEPSDDAKTAAKWQHFQTDQNQQIRAGTNNFSNPTVSSEQGKIGFQSGRLMGCRAGCMVPQQSSSVDVGHQPLSGSSGVGKRLFPRKAAVMSSALKGREK